MVGRPAHAHPAHVLVVEDNQAILPSFERALRRAHDDPAHPAVHPRSIDHNRAAADAVARQTDIVLIDALRNDGDRAVNPNLNRFAGLEVAQALHDLSGGARLVGYSAWANHPAINIAFRDIPSVVAVYSATAVVDHLEDALWGEEHPYAVPPPTEADYAELNLLPSAKPWDALRLTMANPSAWRAVVTYGEVPSLEVSVRDWFNDHLADLLPLREQRRWRWRAYADILQRIAWIH